MAFDFAQGIAAFTKGFADDQVNQINEQRRMDMEMRKAELLEKLRAETEERMLKMRDKIEANRTSVELSGTDGNDMIYRNRDGAEKSRRALTDSEREAIKRQQRESELSAQVKEANIRASDATIRQGDERNALTRRGQDLDAQAARERLSLSKVGADSSTAAGTSTEFGYQLTALNDSAVKQAMDDDKVPREEIQRMATIIAAQHLARGEKNVEKMNDAFLKGLSVLRRGAEGSGQDRVWTNEQFNRSRK